MNFPVRKIANKILSISKQIAYAPPNPSNQLATSHYEQQIVVFRVWLIMILALPMVPIGTNLRYVYMHIIIDHELILV